MKNQRVNTSIVADAPGRRGSIRRALMGGLAVAVTLAATTVWGPVSVANAAVISSFTGPVCPNNTAVRLATWVGTATPAFVPTSSSVVNANTTVSGYPAGSVQVDWISVAGAPQVDLFTPTGTGLASQYSVPSLELKTSVQGAGTIHTIDILLPAPTIIYFPILDVDTQENGTIQGFNGATAVAGTITGRNPAGGLSVTTSGTLTSFNQPAITNYPDNDDRGLIDVYFPTPVTRVRIVDVVPQGTNEIGDIWGCQAQDLVKQVTNQPAIVSTTADTVTYNADMVLRLGNTELLGHLRIYGPQITDSLQTILGGSPTPTSITLREPITAALTTGAGGSTGCIANPSYNGTSVTTMLTGVTTNYLAGGDICEVTIKLQVTYPASTTSFTKNNTATAFGQGSNPTITDTSTNSSTLPGTPKSDTPSPSPLNFPAVAAAGIRVAKTSVGGMGTFGYALTGGVTAADSVTTTASGITVVSGTTHIAAFNTEVKITETPASGFVLSSVTCVDANQSTTGTAPFSPTITSNEVSVPAGVVRPFADITCTFSNVKLGSITIVKDALPNNAQDFAFTTVGSGLSGFTLDDDGDATLSNTSLFSNVVPGSYAVTEGSVAGWSLTGLTCTGDVDNGSNLSVSSAQAAIDVDAGENIVCTFVNTKSPTLQLSKALGSVRSLDTDEFTVSIRTGSATGTVVNSTTNSTTAGSGSTVDAGTGTTGTYTGTAGTTYFLTETPAGTTLLANYSATITCTDASSQQSGLPSSAPYTGSLQITPVPGATVSCVVTNTVLPPQTNAVKSGVSVTGPTAAGVYTANYTVTVSNTGPAPTTYGLTDAPAFSSGLTIAGATWTTSGVGAPAGSSALGSGPYQLAAAATVLPGFGSHAYNVTVSFTFDSYTTPVLACAATPTAGNGLFNAVTMAGETGSTADNTACLQPPAPPEPSLLLVKSVSSVTDNAPTGFGVGDVVNYTFAVTNTGNVTLTNVTLSDPKITEVGGPIASLAPGATNTTTFTGSYVMTQADVDFGGVENRATATGTTPGWCLGHRYIRCGHGPVRRFGCGHDGDEPRNGRDGVAVGCERQHCCVG